MEFSTLPAILPNLYNDRFPEESYICTLKFRDQIIQKEDFFFLTDV